MRQAVADGSAYTGAAKNVVIGGKTGTAEYGPRHADGNYDTHGWFTGFAPYDNPQVAIAVFLENGNGSGNAAPVGSKVMSYYFGRTQKAQAPAASTTR
jgi:penicillin-binding protein 2